MKQFINKLRSRLAFSKNAEQLAYTNPWAGLSSYEDPAKTTNPLKFCGRDAESAELFRLIDNNIVVTLYGKSGIGKTSLLNAGVFPLLRYSNYFPISIRLGISDSVNSYADHLIHTINEGIKQAFGDTAITSIDNGLIPVETDINSDKYLWSYFACHQFCNNNGEVIFPVIVLDQFEENIRSNHEQSVILLQQIAYLQDSQNEIKYTFNDGGSNDYQYNHNFRFVISIREDDLYRLEDCIDNFYLQTLKQCRFRLKGLSLTGAKETILLPSQEVEDLELSGYTDEVVDKVINLLKDANGMVNTLMLSLFCYILYDKTVKIGKCIQLSDIDNYNNILEAYYLNIIKIIPAKQRWYIEDNLVDDKGRRKSIYLSDLQDHAPQAVQFTENSSCHILNITDNRVEVMHDQLAAVILSCRNKRYEEKRTKSLKVSLTTYYVVATYCMWHLLVKTYSLIGGYNVTSSLEFKSRQVPSAEGVMLLSQIAACLILFYYIAYRLPRLICAYFYAYMGKSDIIPIFVRITLVALCSFHFWNETILTYSLYGILAVWTTVILTKVLCK